MINFEVGNKLVCTSELQAFRCCFTVGKKYEINKIAPDECGELVYYIDGDNYYNSISFYYESLIDYFNIKNLERKVKLERLNNIF